MGRQLRYGRMPLQALSATRDRLRGKTGTQVLDYVRSAVRASIYNIGYRIAGTADGYPLPPARLVELVIGTRELAWYRLGGMFMHQAIVTRLRRAGYTPEGFSAVLDFGCGCGRLIRYWGSLKDQVEIWGTDVNPRLVAWCSRRLPFGHFTVNGADPPLPFPADRFDFAYSYSVLTHLSEDRQKPWIGELARVVRPGGALLLTVHGMRVARREGLTPEQLEQLERRGVLVFNAERSGENSCCAYHAESFMRGLSALGLELLEFVPGGCPEASEQDIYLFRKLPAGADGARRWASDGCGSTT